MRAVFGRFAKIGRHFLAIGVTGFGGLTLPAAALANSPPQYCESKAGNTAVGTCDRYFDSIRALAETFSSEWLARRTRENRVTYSWDGPLHHGTYRGSNMVRATRMAYWMNGPYKVTEPFAVDLNAVCHQGPQPIGSRPYPVGTVESQACPYDLTTYRIDLVGASRTRFLPAGPALGMQALVTRDGAPAPSRTVRLTLRGSTTTHVTDSLGIVRFTYTPPSMAGSPTTLLEPISASCDLCGNVATRTILVEPNISTASPPTCAAASLAPQPKPVVQVRTPIPTYKPPRLAQIRSVPNRRPTRMGNPIDVVTGEKVQFDVDWADVGVHALDFARRYGSYGSDIPAAGLGTHWTHNWASRLSVDGEQARIAHGVDGSIIFTRHAATGGWLALGTGDTLTQQGADLSYYRADDESRWLFSADGRLQAVSDRSGRRYTLAYDAAGQLTAVTNAFGRNLQFAYDGAGRLARVTVPGGQAISFAHDTSGRLAAVTHADGATESYHYEDSRWPEALTGVTVPGGQRVSAFTYDAQGRATSTQHAGGAQTYTVSYEQATVVGSTLTAEWNIDPAVFQSVSYVTDPLGTQRMFTWQGGDGSVQLSSSDRPVPGSQVASRSFGPGQLIATESDFMAVQTLYTWDANRKLNLSTVRAANRPEAQTERVEWHPVLRLPVLVTRNGLATSYTYDERGNVLTEIARDPATGLARTWSWIYNDKGLAVAMTDPRGGVWRYSYDEAGNLIAVTDPLQRATVFTHDAAGRTLTQVEPGGLKTSYAYDARGRLASYSQGDASASLAYTAAGLLESVALTNGYRVSYVYDTAGRLTTLLDNQGASVSYALDRAGNVVREEVRGGGRIEQVVSRVVDALDRVIAVQGSLGQTTQIGYDANGAPVSVTDPLNQATRQTLDGLQRTIAATVADGTTMTQSWNAHDQVTEVRDFKGVATRFTYNVFGEVMSETSADIGTIEYTRDASGSPTQIRDAKGQISRLERDALGRIIRIQYSAEHEVAFTYNAAGHVVEIDDPSGGTTLERDAQGRITTKTQRTKDDPRHPSRFRVRYAYSNGDLTGVTYASGLKVTYSRSAGRITGIEVQPPGRNPMPFIVDLTHTALGQPRSWAWPSGAAASRSFDTDGRMTSNEFASYTYDAAGRITSVSQQLLATRSGAQVVRVPVTWLAGYDSRDRLVSFDRPGEQTRFTYDANSNRLTSMQAVRGDADLDLAPRGDHRNRNVAQSLKVDPASNRLLGFTQTVTTLQNDQPRSIVTTPVTYGIDANGSMTSDGLRTFDHDAAGRLAGVRFLLDGEPATISYLHNALGQRVFKSEPQGDDTQPREEVLGEGFVAWLRSNFSWLFTPAGKARANAGRAFVYGDEALPAWALLGEYDSAISIDRGPHEYIWLPTENGGAILVGLYSRGRFYAVHTDHLGTPRLVVDERNKPVWQWPYSAFGNNEPIGWLTGSSGKEPSTLKAVKPLIELNLRFPGQYADAETGLAYNLHRSYLASQGRYTQSDPIGLAGGLNGYLYAEANPLSFTDPLGLDATNWNNTSGGRSKFDFPTNGNWGGGCWSGGQYSCGGKSSGTAPPLDSGDACYQRHDNCYDTCTSKDKKQCVQSCDRKLVEELDALPNDPRLWPSPPRPGTEGDSRSYRDAARRWFR